MAQIFISYSKQDIDFARHLRALLQAAGFEVWLDEKLIPSTQWWRVLEAEIKASRALVVIMSPSSAESRWVEREILVAENANLPIFPVLLAGQGWSRLADIQFEDMTAGLNAALSQRFIDALHAVIDGKPIAKTATQPVAVPVTQVTTERRLLEAAMPAETVRGGETELWAKITLPDSPGLRDELPAVVPGGDVIQKSDARTTSFPFRFPIDPRTGARLPARVTLKARSTDFIVESPGGDDSEMVELPPDSDSRTVIFTLTPKPGGRVSGRARVIVDLVYEKQVIAQISCSTTLVEEATRAAAAAGWGLWSVPVGATSASAGGYGAPGTASRGDDDLASLEELPDAGLDSEEQQRRRGAVIEKAMRNSPPPLPPELTAPAPKPQASARVPADLAGAGVPAPSRIPPRRMLSFPMAASAIAALVLVFGLVFVMMSSQQNTALPPTELGGSVVALAASASPTADATSTREVVIAPTESITEPTRNLVPDIPTAAPSTPSPEAAAASPTPVSIFSPTRTPGGSSTGGGDTGDTPAGRSGVAGTQLTYCGTPEERDVLFAIMNAAQIGYERLEGNPLERIVEQTMDRQGVALLFSGSCFSDGDVLVTAELFRPPDVPGVLHPRSVQYAASISPSDVTASTLYDFVVGMTHYSFGWFNSSTLALLSSAQSAIDPDPNAPNSFASSMNIPDTTAALHLLAGNVRWFGAEDYDGALDAWSSVTPENGTLYTLAQANTGWLMINRIYQSRLGGANLDDPLVIEAIAIARRAIEAARANATDRALTLHIGLLEARLLYLVEGRTSDALAVCTALEAEYATASDVLSCQGAARIAALAASGSACARTQELDAAIRVLNNARGLSFGRDEYEHAYWLARAYRLQATCAADSAARLEANRLTRETATAYLDAAARAAVNLAVERAFMDEARALREVSG